MTIWMPRHPSPTQPHLRNPEATSGSKEFSDDTLPAMTANLALRRSTFLLLTTPTLATQPDPVTPFPLTDCRILASTNETTGSGQNAWHWVPAFVVGFAVGVFGGLLLLAFFRFFSVIWTGRFCDSKGPTVFSPWIRRQVDDLAFLETHEGVAELEMIGRGGCGEVYRASLRSDPQKLVAIKRIAKPLAPSDPSTEIGKESKLMDKKMRQLSSEIRTVGQIRHKNLLPLLAHLPRPDCHYLVYDFMKNGSLEDVLRGVTIGERKLPWTTRLRIAQGIASGIEYLHSQHKPKIIHRDLKPANILLDDNFNARITDFGMAKVVYNANTHVTTSQVAGTPGYIAPEYPQMMRYTDKCDVYSFGVILAVLVVGKTPSDAFFQTTSEMSLVKWVRNAVSAGDENVLRLAVDRQLLSGGYEKQMVLVLKIACFCTVDDPKSRPNSKETRFMLEQVAKEV